MYRKPKNIFLHFLNKDTQDIFGIYANKIEKNKITVLRVGLNASALLCDSETFCIIPLGFWFESSITRSLLIENREYIEYGIVRFSLREDSIEEFIDKKRENYFSLKKQEAVYLNFYDELVLKQLLELKPILINRFTEIGQYCSTKWNNAHAELINCNQGELYSIYLCIDDLSEKIKLANSINEVANKTQEPFVWGKVVNKMVLSNHKDKSFLNKLRLYFEKNYNYAYLEEYKATNLHNFYLLDKGIDFGIEMFSNTVANYKWFETYLKFLNLESILYEPSWKICCIKNSLSWALVYQVYLDICNDNEFLLGKHTFEYTCKKHIQKELITESDKIKSLIRIEKKKEFIMTNLHLNNNSNTDSQIDVLLIVATNDEEKAIIKNSEWKTEKTNEGYEYYTRNEVMSFALVRSIRMGTASTANSLQYYVDYLKPRFIAMVGFSAGKKGSVNLGDVIVPYKIYEYGIGKQLSEKDFLPELNSFQIDPLWKQKVERFENKWQASINIAKPITNEEQRFLFLEEMINHDFTSNISSLLQNKNLPDINVLIREEIKLENLIMQGNSITATPKGKEEFTSEYYLDFKGKYSKSQAKVKVGVLATGNCVQQWSEIFNKLEEKYDRKTCALDMEGYAVADVATFNHIPYIVAKGIGDFANDNKAFDNKYIEYAVYSSYRFIVSFFRSLEGKELLNR